MNANRDDLEIVHIISEFRLLDEDSYERIYWRRDGKPLETGWYLVGWAPGVTERKFNEEARFIGPYRRPEDALRWREVFGAREASRAARRPRDVSTPPQSPTAPAVLRRTGRS
ncbi:MAG TPA: hypothetical protein VLW45_03995 [Pelomicrobium sp.]|nr:hypothetical protein [Pelomicrobium sp.]